MINPEIPSRSKEETIWSSPVSPFLTPDKWAAEHPEFPAFMFPAGLSEADTALHLARRLWFARGDVEKTFKEGCVMIGHVKDRLIVRRAELVSELLPDCNEAEFRSIAQPITNLDRNVEPDQIGFKTAHEFLKKSEVYTEVEDSLIEDTVWFMRAHVCILKRVAPGGELHWRQEAVIVELIDNLVRTYGEGDVPAEDKVHAAKLMLISGLTRVLSN